jgi:ABC-type amino acid transport substrate-binding protein
MKQTDGSWDGISIELWRAIANDLNLDFELQERDLQGLLAGVQDGSLDLAVAALTVTAKREELFDFSHPFHTTGLGIAVPLRGGSIWFGVISRLFSWAFV